MILDGIVRTLTRITAVFWLDPDSQNPRPPTWMASASGAIGILWDVDGTLCDSYMLGFTSTNQILVRHGKASINEADYHAGTRFPTPQRLSWHVTGDPNDPIGVLLGQEFDDLYVALVSAATAPVYPAIGSLLQALQTSNPTVKYGALSNACAGYVTAVLAANGLQGMFECSLGADTAPRPKPFGDGLLHMCNTMRLDPKRCVYVGDSPTDGQAARAAGMAGLGVTWGSHSKQSLMDSFDNTVDSVKDLLAALQELVRGWEFISESVPTH